MFWGELEKPNKSNGNILLGNFNWHGSILPGNLDWHLCM
jgi:hypothetical protein